MVELAVDPPVVVAAFPAGELVEEALAAADVEEVQLITSGRFVTPEIPQKL